MADTRVQTEVEDWVRDTWLQKEFGQAFYRKRLKLSAGGVFDFDGVSADETIIASISTSRAVTSGGKTGVGKLHKLRSDMLFLVMVETVSKRLIVVTEDDMLELLRREQRSGRVPSSVQFLRAEVPMELDLRLRASREVASEEVRPRRSS